MKLTNYKHWIYILILLVSVGCSERKTVLKRRIMSLEKEAGMALSRGDYQKAEKAYLDILKLDSKNQIVKNNLAILYLRYMNKPQKAKKLLEELLKDYPHNSAYINNLAGIYQTRKEYDKAIELYEKAKKYNPTYQMPYYNVGKIYILQGKYKDAVEELRKGLKLSPKDSNIIATLSLALMLDQQLEESRRLLSKAYKETPKSTVILQMICRVDRVMGNLKDAEKILDDYLENNDNNPILMFEKIEIVFERKHELKEIEQLLRKFNEMKILKQLSWCKDYIEARMKLETGQMQEGIIKLEDIYSKIDDRFTYYKGMILRALLDAYNKLGETDKANDAEKNLKKLAPEFLIVQNMETSERVK